MRVEYRLQDALGDIRSYSNYYCYGVKAAEKYAFAYSIIQKFNGEASFL